MEWPHGEKAATDFTATTLPANMSRRQLVRRVKQRWRTERVYEDAKGELGLDHYEAAPSALEPPCVHGAGLLRVYRRERSRAFPLGRKNCHAESVASSRRCGRQPARSGTSGIPSSLCAWPSRASWPHGTPMPLCHRPRSMDRLVHMPVNTDGRLPF